MNVGERIRKIRKNNELTMNDLALKLDISQSYLSKIERGDTKASVDLVEKICSIVGISLGVFFNDDKDLPPDLQKWLSLGKKLTAKQRESLIQIIDTLKENDHE